MSELREKFKTEIENADWDMLRDHHERKAVFLVDKSIDLLDACVAVAVDNTQLVSIWLSDNKLARPDKNQTESFEQEKFKKRFEFIIIQPYVLIKLKDSETLS
jgi:hypothetical protein